MNLMTHCSMCLAPCLVWACSAPHGADDQKPPPAEAGEDAGQATGGKATEPTYLEPTIGLGGAEGRTHPLFGEGSYTGVDPDDPCTREQIWKVDAALELTTGTVVIYDGKLWELSGEANENWAMEICTPPGSGWCAEQYKWIEVGTCDPR